MNLLIFSNSFLISFSFYRKYIMNQIFTKVYFTVFLFKTMEELSVELPAVKQQKLYFFFFFFFKTMDYSNLMYLKLKLK